MFEDSKLIVYDTDGKELGTLNHIEETQLEATADDSEIQRLADSLSEPMHGELIIENVNMNMAILEKLTKARSTRVFSVTMPVFCEGTKETRMYPLYPGDVVHIANMKASDIYSAMLNIIATTYGSEFKQVRKHRKKRINKKWLGRFGLIIKMGYYKEDIQNPHIYSIN